MIAYFDCYSGISGDMTLGALVDLGLSAEWLEDHLKSALGVTEFELRVRPVMRKNICGKKVDVIVSDSSVARDYAHIKNLIETGILSPFAREKSLAVFERLAQAEAAIHNCPLEAVHFHELGGVDAIVDVVGAVAGIEKLGIKQIHSSAVAVGSGTVNCAHGRLPVPAPATLSLLKGVPVYGTDDDRELVTPTGAAIIATLAASFGPVPDMVIGRAGYGAGTMDLPGRPNLLRIVMGTPASRHPDPVEVVETAIDDMNPEVFGHVVESLMDRGALDVCMFPVYMKKNRPGTLLQVLCEKSLLQEITALILSETSAAGLRHYSAGRRVLERTMVSVETPYGTVGAKRLSTPDGRIRIAPEYEDCRRIAKSRDVPVLAVYEAALGSAKEKIDP